MNHPIAVFLFVLLLCFLALRVQATPAEARPTEFHLKFDNPADEPVWSAENDDVMGGISKGGAEICGGVLIFTGALSLENNGGFAQVQILDLGYDFSGKSGMKVRVMGDGRTYELRLATNARHRGSRIAYSGKFPTLAGEWTEVELRFADLKPGHHGNALDGPPIDLSQIEEMSFLIGDGQAGPFSLKVDWMKAE